MIIMPKWLLGGQFDALERLLHLFYLDYLFYLFLYGGDSLKIHF